MNRNRHILLATLAPLTLGLAACGSSETADPAATANSASAYDNTGMADMNMTDPMPAMAGTPDFLVRAANSDMYEIESSRLALQRSKSADIKKFAQQMIDAHTGTTAEMKQIVAAENLTPPPAAMDAEHQGMVDTLKAAAADDFDETYIDQQTAAHEKALALMQGHASSGENAKLKDFATRTAPKIQSHLDMVTRLDESGADDAAAARPAA